MMRAIKPLPIPADWPRASVEPAQLRFVDTDPASLFVDDAYQRNLSEKSRQLIRRIVSNWSWAHVKPPVGVDVDGVIHLVDGQHTAIAALTLGIPSIPVMVIPAVTQADRANAFVAHNRDRVAVTALQIHQAAVAAGEKEAVDIHGVCERSGVTILAMPPYDGRYKPGETMALASIRTMVRKYGVTKAQQTLEVLVGGNVVPIGAPFIKAASEAMHEGAGVDAEKLRAFLTLKPAATYLREANDVAVMRGVPVWKALTGILMRGANSRARAA